ncbi:SDR family oxidoreductase [Sulfitobacter sp. SK011]|uniref:SDR family oxidoreductase n=1 Tax=Sulfitobacter sp. SK011 TaxID=1389004 RepID=UPI000E0A38B6|nr:SDR family oxidoreductase [Sulfitobacter sp. SK011]AXI41954.1 oxidoreductase [Sulfitobacter sp. SK011]
MNNDEQAGTSVKPPPRAVVLGGYGLIGAACLRALKSAGFTVTGVGRDADAARRVDPNGDWLIRDIARTTAADWAHDLAGIDVVVNASGALQDGARDDLTAIHEGAIKALIDGLGDQKTRFIQISAVGVALDAPTAFMSTKARGDANLMNSTLDWIILRPTLVLGRAAYGGTALLRAAAAMPLIGFQVLPDTPVQTIALDDLAAAVVQAARGDIPPGTLADVTSADVHTFASLTNKIRGWLGFAPWRFTITVPQPLLTLTGKIADGLGWLGWRSPFRSTALNVLADGIKGDPAAWHAAGGAACRSLDQTLRDMPATLQDRWFSRLFLLLPVAIATLSLFWMLSGLIGLARTGPAIEVLTSRGIDAGVASFAVIGGGVIDVALGTAILFRRYARRACGAMIAVSLGYLAAGTLLTPDIWVDPLGPFVKVLPGIVLAGMVMALMDDR